MRGRTQGLADTAAVLGRQTRFDFGEIPLSHEHRDRAPHTWVRPLAQHRLRGSDRRSGRVGGAHANGRDRRGSPA